MTPTLPVSPSQTDDTFRVYAYNNGVKNVCADPMALQRKLTQALEGRPDEISKQTSDPDMAIAFPAIEKLLAAMKHVFQLVMLDPATGVGMVEDEVISLWNHFQDWMDKKKERQDSTLKSSPNMAPPSSPFPTNKNLDTTSIFRASGSPGPLK